MALGRARTMPGIRMRHLHRPVPQDVAVPASGSKPREAAPASNARTSQSRLCCQGDIADATHLCARRECFGSLPFSSLLTAGQWIHILFEFDRHSESYQPNPTKKPAPISPLRARRGTRSMDLIYQTHVQTPRAHPDRTELGLRRENHLADSNNCARRRARGGTCDWIVCQSNSSSTLSYP